MTPFIIAQIQTGNSNLDYFVNTLLPIVGPIGIILLGLIALALYVIKTTTDARVSQTKEDVRRDASILDNSIQLTKTLETVATQGVALAKAEGKVDLLNNQLEVEREKRQSEREELKTAIRNLALKVEGYEAEIAELKSSVNGKVKEIAALTLERDSLNQQLKDRDARVMHLEKHVSTLEEEIRGLKLKADESALQIAALGEQLASLDPIQSTDKMKAIVTVGTVEIQHADTVHLPADSFKEFSNSEREDKPNEG